MNDGRPWRPAASLEALRARAKILARIRAFFAARGVMEVSTPVLAPVTATDPQLHSLGIARDGQSWWLQTSPEFHMKRLLAAGSEAIYQIAPAFRGDELGRWHNVEFSMLEWYRPGFDHQALMDEVEALWADLSGQTVAPWPRYRYPELIEQALDMAWEDCSAANLRDALQSRLGDVPDGLDRQGLLDAAMSLLIGPDLDGPCFVHDFPPEQAALARLARAPDGRQWAQRFEWYWQGLELGNGFFELSDAAEQRARFARDQQQRAAAGLPPVPLDEALVAALEQGLPDCAGIAVGVDRLCALLSGCETISGIMAFPADRA